MSEIDLRKMKNRELELQKIKQSIAKIEKENNEKVAMKTVTLQILKDKFNLKNEQEAINYLKDLDKEISSQEKTIEKEFNQLQKEIEKSGIFD